MSQRLVGYGVSQVPTNGMLGGMAYQDPINVTVNNISVDSGTLTVSAGTTALPSISPTGDSNTGIFFPSADTLAVVTAGSNRLHITSGGLVGIGSATPSATLQVDASVGGTIRILRSSVGANYLQFEHDGTHGTITSNGSTGNLLFNVNSSERARIDSSGRLLVGTDTGSYRVQIRTPNTTQISGSLLIQNSSGAGSVYFFNASGTGVSLADAAMWIEKNTSTNRSINAGGTVNASGADYAEYMTKAGDFAIAKGDVCGVTADGQLTTEFADAVSFVVKSTNPSYVGGDTWGNTEVIGERPEDDADALAQWEDDLEAARQTVDRIAFAGQVPVNVMGATPGQYIVPVATEGGGITGIAKDEADLTLTEYVRAVGKVIAIEDDGHARIIVKVA